VARGGSWTYDPRYIRSARRVAFVHDFRGSIGFRLVRDAE
jgi:formylglycine-generating enzyme required for sulfatase activity